MMQRKPTETTADLLKTFLQNQTSKVSLISNPDWLNDLNQLRHQLKRPDEFEGNSYIVEDVVLGKQLAATLRARSTQSNLLKKQHGLVFCHQNCDANYELCVNRELYEEWFRDFQPTTNNLPKQNLQENATTETENLMQIHAKTLLAKLKPQLKNPKDIRNNTFTVDHQTGVVLNTIRKWLSLFGIQTLGGTTSTCPGKTGYEITIDPNIYPEWYNSEPEKVSVGIRNYSPQEIDSLINSISSPQEKIEFLSSNNKIPPTTPTAAAPEPEKVEKPSSMISGESTLHLPKEDSYIPLPHYNLDLSETPLFPGEEFPSEKQEYKRRKF